MSKIFDFCEQGLADNVVVYHGKPDPMRCTTPEGGEMEYPVTGYDGKATSDYLNREPIGAIETAQRYRELAERERAASDLHRRAATEHEKAMQTYLARAALLTGDDGGPDAA